MAILDDFGRFWPFLVDFGSVGGPGGSGKMADRPGKGQLRAWMGLGRDQGPRSGGGRGQILVILGPRGSKFEGPRSKFEVRGQILAILDDFGRFWVGRGHGRV